MKLMKEKHRKIAGGRASREKMAPMKPDDGDKLNLPCAGEDTIFPTKRREVLILENDEIGDEPFVPEIVRSLREYADLLERGIVGHETCDVYEGPRGTRITAISGSLYYEGQIVRSEESFPSPRDDG